MKETEVQETKAVEEGTKEQKIDAEPKQEKSEEAVDITDKLREAEERIRKYQREEQEREWLRRAEESNIFGLERLLPYIDHEKLDEEGFEQLLKIMPEKRHEPRHIGSPSDSGNSRSERSTHSQLVAAAAKARRTGKPEDRAAYSALRMQLTGGNN